MTVNNLWLKHKSYAPVGYDTLNFHGMSYPKQIGDLLDGDNLLWAGKVLDGQVPLIRTGGGTWRSGFVAGDAAILKKFLLYRTYHGSAMSPSVQAASVAAWSDEQHVVENRAKYIEKFTQVTPLLQSVLDVDLPDAGFYLWAKVDKQIPISDIDYAKRLYAEYNVTVLPGSYLARDAHGINPGQNRIRMALVAEIEECLEAAHRIVEFTKKLATH